METLQATTQLVAILHVSGCYPRTAAVGLPAAAATARPVAATTAGFLTPTAGISTPIIVVISPTMVGVTERVSNLRIVIEIHRRCYHGGVTTTTGCENGDLPLFLKTEARTGFIERLKYLALTNV